MHIHLQFILFWLHLNFKRNKTQKSGYVSVQFQSNGKRILFSFYYSIIFLTKPNYNMIHLRFLTTKMMCLAKTFRNFTTFSKDFFSFSCFKIKSFSLKCCHHYHFYTSASFSLTSSYTSEVNISDRQCPLASGSPACFVISFSLCI